MHSLNFPKEAGQTEWTNIIAGRNRFEQWFWESARLLRSWLMFDDWAYCARIGTHGVVEKSRDRSMIVLCDVLHLPMKPTGNGSKKRCMRQYTSVEALPVKLAEICAFSYPLNSRDRLNTLHCLCYFHQFLCRSSWTIGKEEHSNRFSSLLPYALMRKDNDILVSSMTSITFVNCTIKLV